MAEPSLRGRELKLYGIKEPSLTETIENSFGDRKDITWGIYSEQCLDHIVLKIRGHEKQALDRAEKEIRDLVGPLVFTSGKLSMEEEAGSLLSGRNLTISVAESCTGGLIGSRLTDVPGSSRYFLGGVIVYSNRSKEDLLFVSSGTLNRFGAVSGQTVREMASGVKKKFNSHLGLGVTGIAGPDGGSEDKPVGTVFIGLATENAVFSEGYRFPGGRAEIKRSSSNMALDWIRRYLKGDPFIPGFRTSE